MAQSIADKLPELPENERYSATVLNSTTGDLGIRHIQVKPYKELGTAIINEKWTPNKIAKTINQQNNTGGQLF